MKEQIITPPQGYEIDEENSTFKRIVFKKKQPPKYWEHIGSISGYEVNDFSEINYVKDVTTYTKSNERIFARIEQAKASVALAKLSQLLEIYLCGWIPNYTDGQAKYAIIMIAGELEVQECLSREQLLTFKTSDMANEFLNDNRDLIFQAKPLLT